MSISQTTVRTEITSNTQGSNITIGALVQVFFTLLSRIFGMIRDLMVSHIFGASAITDAFFVAFAIPNVWRQFLGEGSLGVAFVPVFYATKEKNNEAKAREFFSDAFGFLLIVLFFVIILGIFFAKGLVNLFAYGFNNNNQQLALAIDLTRWLFPYVGMVSLVALFGAYLQCYRKFAAMSASPIFLNIAMIIIIMFWPIIAEPSIFSLVVGVILGGFIQMLLMAIALKRAKLWQWPSFNFNTDAMKHLLMLLGPALFGIFVYQLNIMVLRQLASFLSEGQISYYYNADRLTQFATGVFAISIATAALPELGASMAKLGKKGLLETLQFTLILTSFIITPCAFGLLVFARPIITTLFAHGAFTITDAMITANTLMAFAPSIIPISFSRPLIQSFYAMGDTKTPVKVGALCVVLNLLIGILLLRFEVVGLAFTLSISSTIQFFLLLWLFKKKVNEPIKLDLWRPFLIHCGLSTIACGVGLFINRWGNFDLGLNLKNALVLFILAGAAAFTYFTFAYYFKLKEAQRFVQSIANRFKINRQ